MEDFTIIRRHLMKNIHSDISFKKGPNRNLKKWVIVFINEETKLTFFSFVYMTSPLLSDSELSNTSNILEFICIAADDAPHTGQPL